MRILTALFLVLVAQIATAAAVPKWKTLWTPDQDNHEVVVYMNYTFESPMKCGKTPKALACTYLADPDDPIRVTTRECLISIERITGPPTEDQLIELGDKLIACLRGQWFPDTNTWEYNFTSVALVVNYDDPDKESVVTGNKREVQGNPCGTSIAPIRGKPNRELRRIYGHEGLHCIVGRWHGND